MAIEYAPVKRELSTGFKQASIGYALDLLNPADLYELAGLNAKIGGFH